MSQVFAEEGTGGILLIDASNAFNQMNRSVAKKLADEAETVFGDEVNITTEGQRHLGAVIGSQEYKDHYCREKVFGWNGETETLSEIAKSLMQPILPLQRVINPSLPISCVQ